MARPTKYKVEYSTDEFVDVFVKQCVRKEMLASLCSYAVYLSVCEDTLQEWKKVHSEFSVSLSRLKQISKNMLINRGLNSTYNSTIAKLILSSNHGMAEKTETKHDITEKTATLLGLIDGSSKGKLPNEQELKNG